MADIQVFNFRAENCSEIVNIPYDLVDSKDAIIQDFIFRLLTTETSCLPLPSYGCLFPVLYQIEIGSNISSLIRQFVRLLIQQVNMTFYPEGLSNVEVLRTSKVGDVWEITFRFIFLDTTTKDIKVCVDLD